MRCLSFGTAGLYARNLRNFDKHILTPIEKAAANAERIWLEGNHELWASQMSESHPELDGVFDHIATLRLKERGWRIVPNKRSIKIGKLTVCHGDVIMGGGMNHARKALEIYGRSVLYGHFHTCQTFSKVSPIDATQRYAAWCSPILGKLNPVYMRNKPNCWMNGFTVVYVMPNGDFAVSSVIVTRGRCVIGGKQYGRR